MDRHSPQVIFSCVVLECSLRPQQCILGLELELSSKGLLSLHHTMFGQHLQVRLQVLGHLEGDLQGYGCPARDKLPTNQNPWNPF